jgi:uncharacterized protein YndB with AHSA1/START domain
MRTEPFTIERTFDAPAEVVWKAISDKDEMKQWYFDLPEFKPEMGFEFRFSAGPPDGRQYLHICEVTEAIAPGKLTYSWRYDGYAGDSHVTFELFADGDKTRLKLTHAGVESFPADNPDFARENFAAGWTDIIDRSLTGFLKRKQH